jgi:AraC-like DNA-binding protein
MVQVSEPESAIRCFEGLHGLLVTVHDLEGRLREHLDPLRLAHRHPRCLSAKASGKERCLAFDVTRPAAELPAEPQGRVQRCPFAVEEAVVPCLRDGRLAWVLFAGPLTRRHDLVLEALRQLAARLRLWEDGHQQWPKGERVERGGGGTPADRRARILRWLEVHHSEAASLDDLAGHLGLSRFQASRAVRSACGRGFRELLSDHRLATARAMLRHTTLPIADIALRSGFGDRANFHRAFRTATGCTPEAWRMAGTSTP